MDRFGPAEPFGPIEIKSENFLPFRVHICAAARGIGRKNPQRGKLTQALQFGGNQPALPLVPFVFQNCHGDLCKIRQDRDLRGHKLSWHRVNHAQGTNAFATAQLQRRAGIKIDVRRTRDQRIRGKAAVQRCVGNHHDIRSLNGMRAERHVPWRAIHPGQPEVCPEPLLIRTDQGNQGDWSAAECCGRSHQGVQSSVGRFVVGPKSFERGQGAQTRKL